MQTPFVHVSDALQHGVPVEQVWFVSAHTMVAEVHVPLVAPAGMEQEVPAQQSASTVQVAPAAWQELPPVVPPVPVQSPHLPLVAPLAMVQVELQQSVLPVQVPPVSLQVVPGAVPVGRQATNPASPYLVQARPAQQLGSVALHDPPNGWHVGALLPPHLRVPVASGAHASLLQH